LAAETRRLELWTDEHGEHFAIKVSGDVDFKAATSSYVKYVRIVDTGLYLADQTYQWKYTLEQWVKNYKKDLQESGSDRQ
jgi:hypothetical protein